MPALDMPAVLTTDPQLLTDLRDLEADESWQRFCRQYAPSVRGLALRSGLSPEDADEVLQETLVKVARYLPAFEYDRSVCRFRTWLNQIVHQRILACLSRRQRRQLTEAALARLAEVSPVAAGVRGEAQGHDELALLDACLARLRAGVPPRHWQIFEAYVLHGLLVREVARIHGTSAANVYVLRHRLAQRFREELAHALELPF